MMFDRFISAVGRHHLAMALVFVAYQVPPLVIPRWGEAWLDAVVLLLGLPFLMAYGILLGWRCSGGQPWWRRLGAIAALLGLSGFTALVLSSMATA